MPDWPTPSARIDSVHALHMPGGGAVADVITPVDGTAGLDPFEGLMIYDTSDDTLKYYDGTSWQTIQTV